MAKDIKKITFFSKLHKELGEKYHLEPYLIMVIRSRFLTEKKSQKEIAEIIVKKIQNKATKHDWQSTLNFVASCSSGEWEEITQITKFDKIADKPAAVSM